MDRICHCKNYTDSRGESGCLGCGKASHRCVCWNGVSMMDSVGRITLAARKGRGKDAAKEVYIAAFPVLRAFL